MKIQTKQNSSISSTLKGSDGSKSPHRLLSNSNDKDLVTSPTTVDFTLPLVNQTVLAPEFIHYAQRFDHWAKILKDGLLNEYHETRQAYSIIQQQEKAQLIADHKLDIDELKDQLASCKLSENNLQKKLQARNLLTDKMITFITKKRNQGVCMKYYTVWKIKSSEKQQISLAYKIADKFHHQNYLRKIIRGWSKVTNSSWRQQTERKIRREADYQMAMLSKDCERRIAELKEIVMLRSKELNGVKQAQNQQQEEMRMAFLRGVSALNAEAMGLFKNNQAALKIPQSYLNDNQRVEKISAPAGKEVWVNADELNNSKLKFTKNDTAHLSSTRGLVTRHYNPSS